METDYKLLLEKYIKYVRTEEGVDYIENRSGSSANSEAGITKDEWKVLTEISTRQNHPH